MTFPKYIKILHRSTCTANEKIRAIDLYKNNEGKMRQDLIKCILVDPKNNLPMIEESSADESIRSLILNKKDKVK